MIPPLRSRLHHGFTPNESSPAVRNSDGGHGVLPMTCYLVREDGEPLVLVASIDLACEIVFSQPPGDYIVYEIQVDPRDFGPGARAGRRSTRCADGRRGDCARVSSGRTIRSRDSVAIQTDPRRRCFRPILNRRSGPFQKYRSGHRHDHPFDDAQFAQEW
jgi:hypothetical protein